jgi:hypothetical protein
MQPPFNTLQHPHEAFGMVFNFDGVVADLPTIKREAWAMLAQQLELPLQQQMLHHPELQVRCCCVGACMYRTTVVAYAAYELSAAAAAEECVLHVRA